MSNFLRLKNDVVPGMSLDVNRFECLLLIYSLPLCRWLPESAGASSIEEFRERWFILGLWCVWRRHGKFSGT